MEQTAGGMIHEDGSLDHSLGQRQQGVDYLAESTFPDDIKRLAPFKLRNGGA
jgi:hypothetical protein